MAAQVPFARAPGLLNPNQVIDYSSDQGIKLYKSATRPLYEDGNLFSVNEEGARDFIGLVGTRARQFSWHDSILEVPVDNANPLGDTLSMLTNHGQLSLDHIREHVATYVAAESRAAQESTALAQMLNDSLSKAGRDKVTTRRDDYTVNGIESGVLLLKVIIQEASIDTNATISTIRTQLSELDKYMVKTGYDIDKFVTHVTKLEEGLAARGAISTDLLNNLFKGLLAAKDHNFHKYILRKEEEYEEGSSNLTPAQLKTLAKTKYRILVEKGQWNAPSAEEEQIVALKAEISALKGVKGSSKDPKTKPKKDHPKKKQGTGDSDSQDIDQTDESWRLIAPSKDKIDEPKQIKNVTVTYWWCAHHKKWVRHKTDDCERRGLSSSDGNADEKKQRDDTKAKKLVSALQGVANDESDEE